METPEVNCCWLDNNTLLLQLPDWQFAKTCTAVEYPDGKAERVFSTLEYGFPMESSNIAIPFSYQNGVDAPDGKGIGLAGVVAYEQCSRLTRTILEEEQFPVGKVYTTLRRIIAGMFDLHEMGVGGLPSSIASFVRTEDISGDCKLYYASKVRRYCKSHDEWDGVVKKDYENMEVYVRELIEQPSNSMQLKKSNELFQHFVDALREHRKRSFREKEETRLFVTGHPLLMEYPKVQRLLKVVGWWLCEPNELQGFVKAALSSIPSSHDWVSAVKGAADDRYVRSLHGRTPDKVYWGSHFVEYCRDFMGHPEDYDLHNGFDWEEMIREFERFYPSYLGLMWVALCQWGVYYD